MIERHKIDLDTEAGRAAWLALRKQDVTASTVGALFDCHPYETRMGLYAEKTGLEIEEKPSAMLEWRLMLEGAVAAAVKKQRPHWRIVKATEYIRDTDLRLGATPDFYIEGDERGLGILQAKTIAPSVYRKSWPNGEPPFWIALQNATEMLLDYEVAFGAVAGLVIDPWKLECPITEIPKHDGVEAKIKAAVARFWGDVSAGREPAPDYSKDAELIAQLYPTTTPLKTVDLTGDNMLPVILAEREQLKRQIKTAQKRCDEIEAEVKAKMADAEVATVNGFAITLKNVHRKAYQVAATDYRRLSISDVRPADNMGSQDDEF